MKDVTRVIHGVYKPTYSWGAHQVHPENAFPLVTHGFPTVYIDSNGFSVTIKKSTGNFRKPCFALKGVP